MATEGETAVDRGREPAKPIFSRLVSFDHPETSGRGRLGRHRARVVPAAVITAVRLATFEPRSA
jgi:hypothetical protein